MLFVTLRGLALSVNAANWCFNLKGEFICEITLLG